MRDVRLSVLQDVYYSPHQKHNVVRSLTLDQLKQFVSTFKSQLFIQGLVQGNMSKEKAVQVDEFVRSKLQYSNLPAESVTDIRYGCWYISVQLSSFPALKVCRVAIRSKYHQTGQSS